MHTSVTQLIQEADGQSVQIEMRLFADDLQHAIAGVRDDTSARSRIAEYMQGRLALSYGAEAPISLQWEGAEVTGDVVLLRLRAAAPRGLAGVRVANSVLCERFGDQVNVVRATYDGRVATLIFSRGDADKPLP